MELYDKKFLIYGNCMVRNFGQPGTCLIGTFCVICRATSYPCFIEFLSARSNDWGRVWDYSLFPTNFFCSRCVANPNFEKASLGILWKVFTKKLQFFGARSLLKLVYFGAEGVCRKDLGSVNKKYISQSSTKLTLWVGGGSNNWEEESPVNPLVYSSIET